MWYYYLAAFLVTVWWFLLRPRGGGKGSPPLVTESKVFPMLPLVGVISEFLKSPNDMMKRCVKDYGSVFTIPVSSLSWRAWMELALHYRTSPRPFIRHGFPRVSSHTLFCLVCLFPDVQSTNDVFDRPRSPVSVFQGQ